MHRTHAVRSPRVHRHRIVSRVIARARSARIMLIMSTPHPKTREIPDHAPSPVERVGTRGGGARRLPDARKRGAHRAAAGAHWPLSDIKHVVLLMRKTDRSITTSARWPASADSTIRMRCDSRMAVRSSFNRTPSIGRPHAAVSPNTRTTNAQKIPSTSHVSVQHERGTTEDGSMAPAHRKADGAKWSVRDGLLHARRHSISVRARRRFTICDASHCSVFGPTWPNRCIG